jgi:hypothetical protein
VPRPAPAPNPGLRASTADRQRYAEYIGMAYATGQLDEAEMSERLDQALRAKTLGELNPIVADLNFAGMAPAAPSQAITPTQSTPPVARRRHRHPIARAVTALVIVGAIAWGVGTAGHMTGLWGWQPVTGMAAPAHVQTYAYWDIDQLPPDLSIDVGNSSVDLTQLTVTHDVSMSIEQDVGNLRIALPSDANVVVHASIDAGSIAVTGNPAGGANQGGVGSDGTWTWTGDPGGPTLTLNVTTDVGHITVG